MNFLNNCQVDCGDLFDIVLTRLLANGASIPPIRAIEDAIPSPLFL